MSIRVRTIAFEATGGPSKERLMEHIRIDDLSGLTQAFAMWTKGLHPWAPCFPKAFEKRPKQRSKVFMKVFKE